MFYDIYGCCAFCTAQNAESCISKCLSPSKTMLFIDKKWNAAISLQCTAQLLAT